MIDIEQMIVRYGGLSLALSCPSDEQSKVRAELEPFFSFHATPCGSTEAFATLRIHLEPKPDKVLPQGEPVPITVDSSLYKHLASNGRRWGDESNYLCQIDVTDTWVAFDKHVGAVDLYQPDPKRCVTETVRLIKGLFTPALEFAGAIQIHASAVLGRSGSVLISGDMWQGKTTLLLEMLSRFDVAQVSCDTVVLSRDAEGRTRLSGWPSPFSVSHGAIADFEQLHPYFPPARSGTPYVRLWSEGKKAVLSSLDVVARFGTVIAPHSPGVNVCLFVRFAPDEPSGIERIRDAKDVATALDTVCLGSRDPIYHNWHQFMTCPGDRLAASISTWADQLIHTSEVYRMTWAPSAVSLMNRVPKIARLHKHLPGILCISDEADD